MRARAFLAPRLRQAAMLAAALPAALFAAEPIAAGPGVGDGPGAAQRPLWELGLGVAALRLPDYRGADQGRNYLLPLPYIVYRGDWLKADRDGARAVLLDTPRVKFDLSLAASAPARSKDNDARRGMRNLKGLAEIGPNLNLGLARSESERWKLDLRLPVRAAFTLEKSPRFAGTTFSPHLNLDLANVAGGWNLGMLTGPVFGDRRNHAYFYGVGAGDATPSRPAYQARGGYGGWQALASTSRRFGNTWVGAFVRYDRLDGAAFDDSPLMRRSAALSAGIGVSWILATSSERVAARD
jgi:outer membrane scaffolding protein for murein synthesis (MipA/OmpV family)